MSNIGTVLFSRGKAGSDSSDNGSADEGNVWDDELLIERYDRALKVAQDQVAKRMAMKTNSLVLEQGESNKLSGDKKQAGKKKKKSLKEFSRGGHHGADGKHLQLKKGAACRAPYSQDGVYYEATLLQILDQDTCQVEFIGYGNEESVLLKDVTLSHGEEARMQQRREANTTEAVAQYDETPTDDDDLELLQGHHQPVSHSKKKKTKKIHRRSPSGEDFRMRSPPGLQDSAPFMPGMPFEHMLPPPPLPPCPGVPEDSALSSMLISWYMSGYYTGLYQGQRMLNSHKKNQGLR